MPTLFIVRGLPGSGKSTYISDTLNNLDYPFSVEWFEADMFYLTNQGYQWRKEHLFHAHSWCYYNTFQTIYSGRDCYVSNTFTTLKEMQRYLDLPSILPCDIKIIELHSQYKSIHDVPEETFQRMKSRWYTFETLPEHVTSLEVIK